jgi:hypothetical protein
MTQLIIGNVIVNGIVEESKLERWVKESKVLKVRPQVYQWIEKEKV